MKSYQMINTPCRSADVTRVAAVADKLKAMGFTIITGQFGARPSVTVKAGDACRLLDSVHTGQHAEGGTLYHTYSAVVDEVRVIWHKPVKKINTH